MDLFPHKILKKFHTSKSVKVLKFEVSFCSSILTKTPQILFTSHDFHFKTETDFHPSASHFIQGRK